MPRYLATQKREVTIEAPNASVARSVAMEYFKDKSRSLTDLIKHGIKISNPQVDSLKIEKV